MIIHSFVTNFSARDVPYDSLSFVSIHTHIYIQDVDRRKPLPKLSHKNLFLPLSDFLNVSWHTFSTYSRCILLLVYFTHSHTSTHAHPHTHTHTHTHTHIHTHITHLQVMKWYVTSTQFALFPVVHCSYVYCCGGGLGQDYLQWPVCYSPSTCTPSIPHPWSLPSAFCLPPSCNPPIHPLSSCIPPIHPLPCS